MLATHPYWQTKAKPWTPKKLGASLVLWLDPSSSPTTLSTASYAGAGTVTQSGTTLTGSLSSFLGEVKVGDVVTADAGSPLISGTVTAIASATSLTLDTSATQVAGQTYKVFPQAGTTDRVSQCNDLGGLGNHATQSTAKQKPALTPAASGIGGRPSFSWDGTDDKLFAHSAAAAIAGDDQPWTVLVVTKLAGSPNAENRFIYADHSATAGILQALDVSSTAYRILKRDDASTTVNVTGGTANTSAHVLVASSPGTTASLWVDGVVTINAAAQNVGTMALDQLTIGAGGVAGASNVLGLVGEIIISNRAWAQREIYQATRYAGRRWGVAVAA